MENGIAYVINLKRRNDRLEKFKESYNKYGPPLELNVIEAIDGKNEKDIERVPQDIISMISDKNDYDNKLVIKYTTMSHLIIWKKIAEGNHDYGVIFEDDCKFRVDYDKLPEICRESLKTRFSKIMEHFDKDKSVLFLGSGDILPIQTHPPSQPMLIRQELSHVINRTNDFVGIPNFNSPYVFNWLGCFSYVMSKNTAKYLLSLNEPITTAIDAHLKNKFNEKKINIYLSIPLMTYSTMDDSDISPQK